MKISEDNVASYLSVCRNEHNSNIPTLQTPKDIMFLSFFAQPSSWRIRLINGHNPSGLRPGPQQRKPGLSDGTPGSLTGIIIVRDEKNRRAKYVWCSRNPEFLLHITDLLHRGEKQTYTSSPCLTGTFKRMSLRVVVYAEEESVCKRRIEAVPLFILSSGINPLCRTTAHNFLQPNASREMMLE